jgi:hypothetical protein
MEAQKDRTCTRSRLRKMTTRFSLAFRPPERTAWVSSVRGASCLFQEREHRTGHRRAARDASANQPIMHLAIAAEA